MQILNGELKPPFQGTHITSAPPNLGACRLQDEEAGEGSGIPRASKAGEAISKACTGSSENLMLFSAPTTRMPSSNMLDTPQAGAIRPDPFCPVLCVDLIVSVVSAAAEQGAGSGSQMLAAEATAAGANAGLWDISHHTAGRSEVDGGRLMFADLVFDS